MVNSNTSIFKAYFAVSLMLNILWALSQIEISGPSIVSAQGQDQMRYFPETGHYVRGLFLQYWTRNGGLQQQGLPLTEEFQERNKLNGKVYNVQYFERAIFEKHPENPTPYNVLLSTLGKFELDSRYPNNSNSAAVRIAAPSSTSLPRNTLTPLPTLTRQPTPTAPPAAMYVAACRNAPELRQQKTWFCMSSEVGDPIGQGRNWIYPQIKMNGWLSDNGDVRFRMNIDSWWEAEFAPPWGKQLFPGRYLNAVRAPFFSPPRPGIWIYGNGRACNDTSGQFEILQFVYNTATTKVESFAANFEQHCNGKVPALYGEIRYNSNVAP